MRKGKSSRICGCESGEGRDPVWPLSQKKVVSSRRNPDSHGEGGVITIDAGRVVGGFRRLQEGGGKGPGLSDTLTGGMRPGGGCFGVWVLVGVFGGGCVLWGVGFRWRAGAGEG